MKDFSNKLIKLLYFVQEPDDSHVNGERLARKKSQCREKKEPGGGCPKRTHV